MECTSHEQRGAEVAIHAHHARHAVLTSVESSHPAQRPERASPDISWRTDHPSKRVEAHDSTVAQADMSHSI